MSSLCIIPGFNIFKDRYNCLFFSCVNKAVNPFCFYGIEKTFSYSVIPAVSFRLKLLSTNGFLMSSFSSPQAYSQSGASTLNSRFSRLDATEQLCFESVVATIFFYVILYMPAFCICWATHRRDTNIIKLQFLGYACTFVSVFAFLMYLSYLFH